LAGDEIYIPSFKISAGETQKIGVYLDTNVSNKYVAFQFDLYLPDGISFVSYDVDRNNVPESTNVSMSQLADGAYRFIAVAMQAEPISGYTPSIVTGVWVGNDDNTVMNKSIQGGTVPALIWKDVMKVATEPYGNGDFNYPEIELVPFNTDAKYIGDDEEEENSDETGQKPEETPSNNNSDLMTPEDIAKQVTNLIKQQKQEGPVNQIIPQQTTQQQVQKQKAAPTPKQIETAPIPMAVPEGLR
jgi:hypothetical protein